MDERDVLATQVQLLLQQLNWAEQMLQALRLKENLRKPVQTSFASFFKIPTESTDIARQIAMNSTTSIRRSPPSYLATNDWGLVSLVARSCCVRPARFLASIIRLQNAVCPAEWTDLPSLRPREAIGAGQ